MLQVKTPKVLRDGRGIKPLKTGVKRGVFRQKTHKKGSKTRRKYREFAPKYPTNQKFDTRGRGQKQWIFGGFRHKKSSKKFLNPPSKFPPKKTPPKCLSNPDEDAGDDDWSAENLPNPLPKSLLVPLIFLFFASLSFEKPLIFRIKTQNFCFPTLLGRYVLPTFFFLKALRLTLARPFLCLIHKGKPEKDKKFFIPCFPFGNPFSQRICWRLVASCPTPEN